MARGLKFQVFEEEGLYFTVTVQLICAFVFEYGKSRFSHDAAHFILFIYLQEVPAALTTTGNQAFVKFVSDGVGTSIGFRMTFTS